MQRERGTAIIMITHDLGVVAETAIMLSSYAGKIAEKADVVSLFNSPKHPYTNALFKVSLIWQEMKSVYTIKGMVPSAYDFPRVVDFEIDVNCNRKLV